MCDGKWSNVFCQDETDPLERSLREGEIDILMESKVQTIISHLVDNTPRNKDLTRPFWQLISSAIFKQLDTTKKKKKKIQCEGRKH